VDRENIPQGLRRNGAHELSHLEHFFS